MNCVSLSRSCPISLTCQNVFALLIKTLILCTWHRLFCIQGFLHCSKNFSVFFLSNSASFSCNVIWAAFDNFLFTKYPPHFLCYNELDKILSEYDVFSLFSKSPEIIVVGQNVETRKTLQKSAWMSFHNTDIVF